jgi:integrase
MDDMPRPRPLHLHRYVTRHGRAVWYVRSSYPPRKKIRVRAEYGTPEFEEEYLAALNGEKPKPKAKTRTGSLKWLYARYREADAWLALAASTRKARENIFAHVMETGGEEPYTAIKRADIEEGKSRRRETPSAARDFLDAMRGMFRWAVEAGLVTVDPTTGVRNPKRKKSEGFKAWTMDDVTKYEARWAQGTRQRVWLHVLLYTGCRRGDAVVLGRQHVRDGVITFVTEKGRDKNRIEVSRHIEPELAATLAQGPCGDLAFICGERGTPLTKESFGNEFKAACVEAGIFDKSAHGLRKLSATLWAEHGATEHELMAMFGWLTPAMAALYTRKVDRRRLAMSAAERLARTR